MEANCKHLKWPEASGSGKNGTSQQRPHRPHHRATSTEEFLSISCISNCNNCALKQFTEESLHAKLSQRRVSNWKKLNAENIYGPYVNMFGHWPLDMPFRALLWQHFSDNKSQLQVVLKMHTDTPTYIYWGGPNSFLLFCIQLRKSCIRIQSAHGNLRRN